MFSRRARSSRDGSRFRRIFVDDMERNTSKKNRANSERRDAVSRSVQGDPIAVSPERSDLACIKGTLESSSFISRLTTEHRQMRARKCKANYIYIYISVAKQQLPAAN